MIIKGGDILGEWYSIIILTALLITYAFSRVIGVFYFSDFLEEANVEKKWAYYNKFTTIKNWSTLSVLLLSIIGFFMEALNKGSYFSMSIMIAYALIVINTLSSLFDTIEDRSGVAKELNIPINKCGEIFTFLKTKLK